MITRFIAIMFVVASLGVGPVLAQNNNEHSKRAQEAGKVVQEVMGIPEDGIPQDLMSRATAIAVIPNMVKAAFGIGGTFGKGLVSQRLANGHWGPPAYIEIGGGSIGFQLGAEATDVVLVFTNREGLDGLLKGKLKLGADAGVAAGPVGRKAEIATDVLLKSPIVSYSRSKGLFAGVSLEGSVLAIDDSANAKVYGKNVDTRTILDGKVQINAAVRPFVDTLEKYSPAAKQSTGR